MRVTIKDIASKAGYSVTTVSLVLNNKASHIPMETRNAIFSVAEEMNYRPNQLAVSMVTKRTKTIGLIISDVRNLFFSTLAKGVEDECRRNGWNLILCNTNDMHQRDLEYIQVLTDKRVDGILFCMALDSDEKKAKESIELMINNRVPFIMMDRYIESMDSVSIAVDHKRGGFLATEHLIALGHKKIGCITGPLNLTDSMKRLDGYKEALASSNIPYDDSLIFEGDYSINSGFEYTEELVKKGVTAVFAFNDLTAFGVYNQVRKLKLSIPKDLSIVGYDDIFFSELLDVPLTTVHQPVYEMGVDGVQQLIYKVEKDSVGGKNTTFSPHLVVRESTGAPKIT